MCDCEQPTDLWKNGVATEMDDVELLLGVDDFVVMSLYSYWQQTLFDAAGEAR
jgi:hypothetical protein